MTMERIFSSASLRDRLREVKEAAHEDVVRITENGNSAFVFCSEEVFERRLQRAAEEARHAERMAQAIRGGRTDHAAGRTHPIDEAFALVDSRRQRRVLTPSCATGSRTSPPTIGLTASSTTSTARSE